MRYDVKILILKMRSRHLDQNRMLRSILVRVPEPKRMVKVGGGKRRWREALVTADQKSH